MPWGKAPFAKAPTGKGEGRAGGSTMRGWLLVLTLVDLALANAIMWFVIAQE